jgi:mRNA-degrading endonuclease YafQ of YafQ-DinJ toxin-antitoxin module
MKYQRGQQFKKDYKALPAELQEAARKSFALFQQDTRHPSLRVKKMQGHDDIWEGHVTRGCVFTFHWESDPDTGEQIAVFRRIGTHAIYDKP